MAIKADKAVAARGFTSASWVRMKRVHVVGDAITIGGLKFLS